MTALLLGGIAAAAAVGTAIFRKKKCPAASGEEMKNQKQTKKPR